MKIFKNIKRKIYQMYIIWKNNYTYEREYNKYKIIYFHQLKSSMNDEYDYISYLYDDDKLLSNEQFKFMCEELEKSIEND